jgi:centromere/kinetochore protein ZW10
LALENLSSLLLSLVENDGDDFKFLDHCTWVKLDESIPSLKKFRKLAGTVILNFGTILNFSYVFMFTPLILNNIDVA